MAEGSLAGVTGVEPAETRFGDERLTVWRHPYIFEIGGEGGSRTHGRLSPTAI